MHFKCKPAKNILTLALFFIHGSCGLDFKMQKRECTNELEKHKKIVEQYFEKRKDWKTSNLGSILFKNIEPYVFNRRKKFFNVLLWQFSEQMQQRYTYNEHDKDTLDGCSVDNCGFYENPFALDIVDVIVIHINRGPLPALEKRSTINRWILLNDEPPVNKASRMSAFYPIGKWKGIDKLFNWTMSYRSDSDIPVPYGRTIPLKKPLEVNFYDAETALNKLVPHWDEKQMVTVAATIVDGCRNDEKEEEFLEELNKHLKIDVEPVNVHTVCTDADCKPLREYLFFIVLETVSCRQYLSEKVFSYAYSAGSIPVISGPPLEDCDKLLPPGSFVHVDFFKSPEDLANNLLQIASDPKAILSYHSWRKHFAVTNEHGYFQTRAMHYCRICEALNYNDGESTSYDADDLRLFFDEKLACDAEFNKPKRVKKSNK